MKETAGSKLLSLKTYKEIAANLIFAAILLMNTIFINCWVISQCLLLNNLLLYHYLNHLYSITDGGHHIISSG